MEVLCNENTHIFCDIFKKYKKSDILFCKKKIK